MYLRTIYSGKERGIANRGHFLTCERVEEDSKQEQDARMTVIDRISKDACLNNVLSGALLQSLFVMYYQGL